MNTVSSLQELIGRIDGRVRLELRTRCEAIQPDFERPQVYSVVTALLARQATLMIELSNAPLLWNSHSAPLVLRAMADVHITFAWIVLEPEQRTQRYIEYGLGQAVLEVEHRKNEIESEDESQKAALQEIIDHRQAWIDMQRLSFMVEVNVGAWAGKNTRQMAEEAGIIDFYNYVYAPFSQCAHSSWYHVGRFNSSISDSPYTRLLWIPEITELDIEPWNLVLASKYLDKTFNVFDDKILRKPGTSDVQSWIYAIMTSDESGEDSPAEGS